MRSVTSLVIDEQRRREFQPGHVHLGRIPIHELAMLDEFVYKDFATIRTNPPR